MSVMTCEFPLPFPVYEWPFLTFLFSNPQYCDKGEHQLSSLFGLGPRNHDQYYTFATTAILFYDYLLTLGDEVS